VNKLKTIFWHYVHLRATCDSRSPLCISVFMASTQGLYGG